MKNNVKLDDAPSPNEEDDGKDLEAPEFELRVPPAALYTVVETDSNDRIANPGPGMVTSHSVLHEMAVF
jgi:hypothetical protein